MEIEFYDGTRNVSILGHVDSVRNESCDIVVDGKVILFSVIGILKLVEKKSI